MHRTLNVYRDTCGSIRNTAEDRLLYGIFWSAGDVSLSWAHDRAQHQPLAETAGSRYFDLCELLLREMGATYDDTARAVLTAENAREDAERAAVKAARAAKRAKRAA